MMMARLPHFVGALLVATALFVPSEASAHEPVFSPGPHTIFEDGVSASVGTTVATLPDGATRVGLRAGAVYGVTADLNLAASLPVAVSRSTHDGELTAVGDASFQIKWRPWKSLAKGRIDSVSLIGALKLPTGHHDVSRGNTGFTFGATAAREHQRYYLFGSIRYTTQTVGRGGTKPGDVFSYDVATGVRPVVLEYDDPDAVVLVEFNGTTRRPVQRAPDDSDETTHRNQPLPPSDSPYETRRQAHTGGTVGFDGGTQGGTELAVSPELLVSWGPVMLKGGVQFPFFDTFDAAAAPPNYRIKSSLIVQF